MPGETVRLFVPGQILGYKRSKANQYNHTALIKIDGVVSKKVRRACGEGLGDWMGAGAAAGK
jgi:ribosomal protein L35AE/L33A